MRYNQAERQRLDREFWERLAALAAAGDVAGFYAEYVRYLEWTGNEPLSKRREILLAMARAAAKWH